MISKIKTVVITATLGTLLVTAGCDVSVNEEQMLAEAREYIEQGEVRSAAIELKNILRANPANLEARTLLGKVSIQTGDIEGAVRDLQRARELGAIPESYVVPLARALLKTDQFEEIFDLDAENLSAVQRSAFLAAQGQAFLRLGNTEDAIRDFNEALDLQPDNAEASIGVATVAVAEGDLEKASTILRRVTTQKPKLHSGHAALGRLLAYQSDMAGAEASFRMAIENASGTQFERERMGYLGGLVDVLLAQDKAGAAQDVAQQMLELAPQHPLGLFQSARADFEAGQYDAVIEKTQQVVSAYPDYQPAAVLLAAAAMAKENFALAEMHLRAVVSAAPDNAQARRLLAQAKMNLGNPEEALQALKPLLNSEVADAALLTMAGSASLRSGQISEGIDYINRGLESGSGNKEVRFEAARSFIRVEQPEKALEILEQAPEEWRDIEYDSIVAEAILDTGNRSRAREYAMAVLDEHPEEPDAHRLLGQLLLAMGDTDEARTRLQAGLKLDPKDEKLVVALARLELSTGKPDMARAQYEALLEKDRNNLIAMLGLSQVAEAEGRLDDMETWLTRAANRNPKSAQPLLLLARLYLNTNRPKLALQRSTQAVQLGNSDARALTLLGRSQMESDRYSEAKVSLERAVKLSPQSVEANFELARAQLKLGITDAARGSLNRTLDLQPEHLGAKVALARLEAISGNYRAAQGHAQALKERYPDRAEPHLLEGDIHMMRGQYNDGIAAYDRAATHLDNNIIALKRYDARRQAGRADSHVILETYLQKNPDDLVTRTTLAEAYHVNGLSEKAVEEYRRVVEADPENYVALNNLAWVYAELGGPENLAKGLEVARRAYKKLPDNGLIVDTYAWLLLHRGEVAEATNLLREAVRLEPDNPDVRYHLAVALHRSGAAQEARDLLDVLLSGENNFGSRDEAYQLRERL